MNANLVVLLTVLTVAVVMVLKFGLLLGLAVFAGIVACSAVWFALAVRS